MLKTVNPIHFSSGLHKDAGTFLSTYYADADRVFTLFDSTCWINQLMLDDALDASKLFVRSIMPHAHRERFVPLTILEKVYKEGKKNILTYGEPCRYGDPIYYGHPETTITGGVELPEHILDADICCDLPVDPAITLLKGEHFTIRNGYLFFHADPFTLFPENTDETNDQRTLHVYLRGVTFDQQYVQERLGILTGTHGASTKAYLDFSNLVMDSIQEGTGYQKLAQLLCGLFDVPCTKAKETIEQIGVSNSARWLVTDQNVYSAPLSASFLYKPGDVLPAGTILTDAIIPIQGRTLPEEMPVILERRFLGPEYKAGLIFPNEEVPLEITSTLPWPTFKLIGRDEDVLTFWESFYSRVADRAILRQVAPGGRINPAKFVHEHVLYPRAMFYLIHTKKLGPNKLPMINTRLLRGLLPPGLLFSLLLVSEQSCLPVTLPAISVSETMIYASMPQITLRGTLRFSASPVKKCD